MRGHIDLTNLVFGRLTARYTVPPPRENTPTEVWWYCDCSCGGNTIVRGISLRREDTKSCGCLRRENCTKLFGDPRRKYSSKTEKRLAEYQRNREHYKFKNKRRYTRNTEILNQFKNKPCADCGKKYHPILMDCDHLPQYEKVFCIGKKWGRVSAESLQDELNKCDVVCAMCHRVRTYNRDHQEIQISSQPID